MQIVKSIWNWRDHPAIARSLPFVVYIVFLALTPVLQRWAANDLRWLYGVQILCVFAVLVLYWRQYREINTGFGLSLGQCFFAAAVGVVVFVLWINLDLPWATLGESKGFDPRQADSALNWPLVAMRIFGAAVIVPVMEELFWRSLVMRWIDRPDFQTLSPKRAGLRAVLMSSVVFGLEHSLWFAGIVAGLAYAWIYRTTGNLWAPIIAHAVTNLTLGLWVVSSGNWQFW